MKSLLTIDDLTTDEIDQIFELAGFFIKNGIESNLESKLIFSLFFEPSTRTETSFSVAAKKLGCITEKININNLATKKGEDLIDVISTLNSMQPDLFIIRHNETGILHLLNNYITSSMINAGDGINEHPTQALVDAFTILKIKERIEDLNILICGDIKHSRVAHSDMKIFKMLGANISISGPITMMPDIIGNNIKYYHKLEDGIKHADVIIILRIQNERIIDNSLPSINEYKRFFCLNDEKFRYAKEDVLIMHPGPVNREVEISSSIISHKNSAILQQVRNGIFIRAATIEFLLEA
jgi:aspartate carbamoyltransferase catalytic subunit